MQDCRVAFSIHGTNTFIVATKKLNVAKLPVGFMIVDSRAYEAWGVKLHWEELLTRTGEPLRSPTHVVARFTKLEAMGWKVDKAAFLAKHWPKKAKADAKADAKVSLAQTVKNAQAAKAVKAGIAKVGTTKTSAVSAASAKAVKKAPTARAAR